MAGKPREVYRFMLREWGLQRPTMLVSVTGDAGKSLSGRMRARAPFMCNLCSAAAQRSSHHTLTHHGLAGDWRGNQLQKTDGRTAERTGQTKRETCYLHEFLVDIAVSSHTHTHTHTTPASASAGALPGGLRHCIRGGGRGHQRLDPEWRHALGRHGAYRTHGRWCVAAASRQPRLFCTCCS